jgi:hypothetical protein
VAAGRSPRDEPALTALECARPHPAHGWSLFLRAVAGGSASLHALLANTQPLGPRAWDVKVLADPTDPKSDDCGYYYYSPHPRRSGPDSAVAGSSEGERYASLSPLHVAAGVADPAEFRPLAIMLCTLAGGEGSELARKWERAQDARG